MSLDYAILGFLSYGPLTGYDLKKRFDESVRNFWPATQSQIYLTLKRLAADGLVSVEVVAQTDLPDRKVHHLTEPGLAALRAWLAEPAADAPHRSAWLIQVFFAHLLDEEQLLGLFRQRRAEIAGHLEYLGQEVQANIPRRFAELQSERYRRLWQLTLNNGLAHLQAELAWLDASIETLSSPTVD